MVRGVMLMTDGYAIIFSAGPATCSRTQGQ